MHVSMEAVVEGDEANSSQSSRPLNFALKFGTESYR